ncbi:NPC1-like intracellular cholesterol transporter 1 isoform X2 [Hemibagrus wyckioides]|uniref:NPC1-like intracellular cholesterol transporter 1 isoform X2 n=1 Tax=Hemibagrus wyckioides TaxID=337641 RepID=UPI00266C0765|nr:NPC1-like intracellular cholesterol transporter 1 isoform X2 [Hemibagrus wyckioides]
MGVLTKKWDSGVVFLILAAYLVLCEAQPKPGFCVMYDECGLNPNVENSLIPARIPCRSYQQARPVTGQHYQLLKEVCPMLDRGVGQTFACCTSTQLLALQSSLTLSKAVLIRCPSCAYNFAHVHCITTCSPDQSQVVNITKTVNLTVNGVLKDAVVAYQAYISTSFSDASFRSCQNVRIPATGGYAIATMCGRYGHKLCTPQRWLDFQGDTSNGLAPLDIDFRLIPPGETSQVPEGMVPYAGLAIGCNETSPTGEPECSCQDCLDACPSIPPPEPIPENPFMVGDMNGILFICLIVFICLCLLFLGFTVAKFVYQTCKSKMSKGGIDKNANNVSYNQTVNPKDVTCSDRASLAVQKFLGSRFQTWGTIMARYPKTVIIVCLVAVVAFTTGLMNIELTTDPVQLWSAPNSRARREKDFNDLHFDPFFRTNQLILTAPGRPGYMYDSLLFGKTNFSGLVSKDLILQLLELQERIQAIEFWSDALNKTASLKDVCYAPLNPTNPSLTDCAVNSLPQYFQNSLANLNAKANMTELGVTKEVDWRDHLIYCVNSPLSFKDITALGMSCMADYGAPVFPFLAVGGYDNEDYTNAEAFILTFSLSNYPREHPKFKVVQEWELRFLDIVQEYQKDPRTNFTFAYMAERSLEDEINRTTIEDIPIFMISYAVIFLYIAVALGEYSSFKRILRDVRRPDETREEQIGRVLGNVAPSMLLCSMSESVCFFLGALSTMPAVRSFALYAALAVLMDFMLQMTAFVALLSLDARRQDANRCEIACCVTVKEPRSTKLKEGFLMPIMRKYYAPVLLHPVSRIAVIVVFLFMFCGSIYLMFNVKVGLDQELAMPTDSYMLTYFAYLYKYFEVGVPVYFVTTRGFNFSSVNGMNAVCSSVGCDQFSLTQKIQYATAYPDRSYLAIPASSWVDDFIDWLNPQSRCCRLYSFGPDAGNFCPANVSNLMCWKKCMRTPSNGVLRPSVEEFDKYLPNFLTNRPDLQCPKGGLGAYDTSVVRDNVTGEILASRFMAYHTPLTNSQEFTAALLTARELAHNITKQMRNLSDTAPDFEVFPYSITYVYYEQYTTIVYEGLVNLALCLLPTFVVCCILLGMDLSSGLLNLLTIVMITVDTVGVMTLWSIDYNAVSLINLVTAVGISVEFVSHITRSFALSTLPTKVERAKDATAKMGSAVFAGVAMTNLPGIIVLAFAKAQLIQIFFFRLNLVITLLGMAHGLIFLPVLLSFFGPSVNKALLLEQQKEKAIEMAQHNREVYDNGGFERTENHVSSEPHYATTLSDPNPPVPLEQAMTPEPSTEEDTTQSQRITAL